MRPMWIVALMFSLGLNAGLLAMALVHRSEAPAEGTGTPGHDAGSSPAEGREPARRPADPGTAIRSHLDRLTQDLSLSESQRAAIGAVHEKLLPRIVAERSEMAETRKQVTALYGATQVDTARFRGLVRWLSLAQARLDSLVTEAILGEAAVLTHEQRLRYIRQSPWGHPMAPPEQSERRSDERTSEPARPAGSLDDSSRGTSAVKPRPDEVRPQQGGGPAPRRDGAPPPRPGREQPPRQGDRPPPPRPGQEPPPRDGAPPPPRPGEQPPQRER